ncbi:pyridoxamine 5'-phosphate oxidase family protein [Kitasatospora sp. NPDC088346]|uniref:pyridoxamine 5'-phosphate oxidase family protein n=1 Tax=Kitasatospora sp. NPDC088346 TaxID=3364073 RepID=UPI0038021F09
MAEQEPVPELDPRYSDQGAQPTGWSEARARLAEAELYWLSTVRPDGRPHVTPLIAVWVDGALHFCTGRGERKAANLAGNPHCVLTTGCNNLAGGLDVVVEGEAVRLTEAASLGAVAEAYEREYGSDWHFEVRDGCFVSGGDEILVFRVAPVTAFGFGKGAYSQTRWRFDRD